MKKFRIPLIVICVMLLAIGGYTATNKADWGDDVYIDPDGVIYAGQGISMGGEEKSAWGSIVSPMTDYTGYVAPTDAGSKLKLHDDGDLTLGGAVATDVVITFDSDSHDYYIGVDDTENELHIGYGSDVTATEQMSFGSASAITLGEDTDTDFGLIYQSGAQDYYVGVDYTGGVEEDLFVIGVGTTCPGAPAFAIGKAAGAVYINAIDTVGAADIDIGTSDVTDVTVVTDGGIIIIDGQFTLPCGEIISNTAVDDTLRIESDDSDITLEIYGGSGKDAILALTSDASAGDGDDWTIKNDNADSNNLIFGNDSTGSAATKLTVGKTGIITTTNYIEAKITDTTTDAVVDILKLTHDGGTAGTGVGAGLVIQIDDAGGIEEQASIDVVLTTVTDGSEDADIIFSQNIAGVITETVRFDADAGIDLPSAGYVITLPYDEVITNATDDMVQIYSNDSDMRVEVYSPKAADGDATLSLQGDAAGAAHSRWDFISDTGADTLIIKSDSSTVDTMVTKLTVASADGDITTTGDIEIVDDMDLVFGTNSDWKVQYDETVDDQLLFITAGTSCTNVTDPMVVFLVGGTPTADQEVFGISKGTQASNTPLFTVDEDGDVDITGSVIDVLTLGAELVLSNETVTCSSADPQGVGVADPDVIVTFVVTDNTGASADLVTLADGTTAGEIKIIILKTDTETAGLIMRPATYGGGTEVLFEDAGDGCTLIWDGTSWNMVSNNGGTSS